MVGVLFHPHKITARRRIGRAITINTSAARKTLTINADSERTTYSYDDNGRNTSVIDALGHATSLFYDNFNRLTGKDFASRAFYSYDYDLAGNLMVMDDASGHTTYTYDAKNRLSTQQDPVGKTTSYVYDNDDRLSTKSITPGVGTYTYSYDNANRQTQQVNPQSEVTTTAWDADSRLTLQTLSNGVAVNSSYDAARRLTSRTQVNGTVTLASFAYGYNTADMRTSMVDAAVRDIST